MLRGGDDICPTGFAPHSVRPTRCKRCFRDYSEHKKRGEKVLTPPAPAPTAPQREEPLTSAPDTPTTPSASGTATRRRRPKPAEEEAEDAAAAAATTRRRVRTRPGSWSYSSTESEPAATEEDRSAHHPPTDVGDAHQVNSPDVEFILHVKQKRAQEEAKEDEEDALSTAPTETTITMVQEEGNEDLRAKVRQLSDRCAQLEREKSAELLALRAQLFELRTRNEDCVDESNSLRLEVQELRRDLDARPTQEDVRRAVTELQSKLHAAEALCEELMDENEAMKREMRDMEDELDEMQDNFREEQADEYRDLKKELEQASKNCRILQFKLRKSDRRAEQLDLDNAALKQKMEGHPEAELAQLQAELNSARQVALQMQADTQRLKGKDDDDDDEDLQTRGSSPPALPPLRGHPDGGSNKDDPAQLLRELCDSVERERDLREQLKFSEEEAKSLRNKLTRVEEENESFVMQMKKMATGGKQSRARRSADQDPDVAGEPEGPCQADLKLQLELNEQETLLLTKKLRETSEENDRLRVELSASQERLEDWQRAAAAAKTKTKTKTQQALSREGHPEAGTDLLRQEATELRRKILGSERENENLKAQLEALRGRRGSKALALSQRSKSLDGDAQLDLRRQLQLVEQEASILRQKVVDAEAENDRLVGENRALQLRPGTASKTKQKKTDSGTQTEQAARERAEADGEMTDADSAATGRKLKEAEKRLGELAAELKEAEEAKGKVQRSLDETRKQLETDKEKLKRVDTRQSQVAVGWLKEREDLKKQLEAQEKRSQDREAELKSLRARALEAEDACRRERDAWRGERLDLEAEAKSERKSRERAERLHENELRDRDEDLLALRDRAKKAEAESKRLAERNAAAEEETRDRLKGLERDLAREKQEYEDLTTKYDMLEEDYVVTKAQLVMDREKAESNHNALKRQHSQVEGELRTLRETFNVRQDTWIKDKLDMQERIKELLGKLSRSGPALSDVNKERFKEIIDEKNSLVEQLKKEDRLLREDVDRLRRQTEDQRKMLEDYERLQSFGSRNVGGDSAAYERQLRHLQDTIDQGEKRNRSELASLKMEYEQRVVTLADQAQASRGQLDKVVRERDAYRQMLQGAGGDNASDKPDGGSSEALAEIRELKRQADEAREAKVTLQDQLDDALRAASRLTMELFTEKMRASETQTKLNELEETTILQGGKSRIFGVKTKLELAWQKEREEQHRLLNEAHKMTTDTKQRLLAVEASRDQERLEAKRTVDGLRSAADEQKAQAEARTRELRDDLVDLRDNLTKMRAAHERVRRERDRCEREKDDLRALACEVREADDLHRAIFAALVEELRKMQASSQALVQMAASGSKKTEAERANHEFREALRKVDGVAEEIRRSLQTEDERRANRARALAVKRSAAETGAGAGAGALEGSGTRRSTNLNRKSLSLDQDLASDAAAVWKAAEAAPSCSSMSERPTPSPRTRRRTRKPALTPSGSVESDSASDMSVTDSEASGKKSVSSVRHALRRLTKSKSVEASWTGDRIARAGVQAMGPGLGQSSDAMTDNKKKDPSPSPSLKSKLTGLFRRTPSRSSSVERSDPDADQRAATLPRFGGSAGALHLHRAQDRK